MGKRDRCAVFGCNIMIALNLINEYGRRISKKICCSSTYRRSSQDPLGSLPLAIIHCLFSRLELFLKKQGRVYMRMPHIFSSQSFSAE